ncbi:hypothetical protein [Bradymonas sediminis]|uniref:Uncharacterized protein n=1 Tax=Bradymonas sediminis TaxID=1548548 RepID=A0A2Z4FL08_9DELT|nr:hypothetical protein [Bradymonas sediminis]AWV89681.1 hypothetical protein DN745_10150 [Bradymonas sediminis]TDP76578.1 hypothetical protein DFR33_102210 [Bradymonas sediminis]
MWQFALALGLLGLGPTAAWAHSNADSNARMLELNEQGFAAFGEEDYLRAARKFEAAHDYVADPILRKNAAIAWFKAERCVEASEAAVFFLLAEGTLRQDRDEARSVWGHCQLDQADRAFAAGDVDRAEAIIARVDAVRTDARVKQRLAGARMRLIEMRVNGAEGDLDRVSLGWGLVSVGAAVLIGTGAYHLSADGLDGAAKWAVPTLYGAGTLSTLGGLSLVYLGNNASQESEKPAALRAPAPAFEIGLSMRF